MVTAPSLESLLDRPLGREFIKRNDEFTVNIALVENGLPILGSTPPPCQRKTALAASLARR